jgi:hypothetical protein
MKTVTYTLFSFFFLFIISSCKENEPIIIDPKTPFQVVFDNKFSIIENRYAAFLSDKDGKTLAFRWLNGEDTTQLTIGDWGATLPQPDLTLIRIQKIVSSVGVDSSLYVQTFTGIKNGTSLLLDQKEYERTTFLNFTLTGVTSVDTIIVPDGLTFSKPSNLNNFTGVYRVQHTGKIWFRLRVNGEDFWRYMFFDNVQADQLTAELPIALLPHQEKPKTIALPYITNWKFRVDGILDTSRNEYLALGDLSRAPGGASFSFSELKVFEPIPFDPIPNPPFYSGYRIKFSGINVDGNGYHLDDYFTSIPSTLPQPTFSIEPGIFSDNRLVACKTTGTFDAMVFIRKKEGNTSITWETFHHPMANIEYRLPDIPLQIATTYPDLSQYNFNQQVNGRAESYTRKNGYEEVIQSIFRDIDPFWRTKAGYLGLEKVL